MAMIEAITNEAQVSRDTQTQKVIKKAVKKVAKVAKDAVKSSPMKVVASNITKKIANKMPSTKNIT